MKKVLVFCAALVLLVSGLAFAQNQGEVYIGYRYLYDVRLSPEDSRWFITYPQNMVIDERGYTSVNLTAIGNDFYPATCWGWKKQNLGNGLCRIEVTTNGRHGKLFGSFMFTPKLPGQIDIVFSVPYNQDLNLSFLAVPRCLNECAYSNERVCVGENSCKVCGNYDTDPCLEWSPVYQCATGQVYRDGKCTYDIPPIQIPVGEWHHGFSRDLNMGDECVGVTFNPGYFQISLIQVIDDEKQEIIPASYSCSYKWENGEMKLYGFLVNIPLEYQSRHLSLRFVYSPTTNGFLFMHFEHSSGIKFTWVVEGVSNSLPGAPPKQQAKNQKLGANKWGAIRFER